MTQMGLEINGWQSQIPIMLLRVIRAGILAKNTQIEILNYMSLKHLDDISYDYIGMRNRLVAVSPKCFLLL